MYPFNCCIVWYVRVFMLQSSTSLSCRVQVIRGRRVDATGWSSQEPSKLRAICTTSSTLYEAQHIATTWIMQCLDNVLARMHPQRIVRGGNQRGAQQAIGWTIEGTALRYNRDDRE